MSTKSKTDRDEAVARLREWVKPGDTLHTILRHVSRSGMSRIIDVVKLENGEALWLGGSVAAVLENPYVDRKQGIRVGGCGMDMGFHLINNLSYALYRDGYACLGKEGKCPSNYHMNHHDTVRCEGTMVWNNDGPNTGSPCQWRGYEEGPPRGWVITDDNGENPRRCPKCKGKGRVPNPAGPERFDLTHTDGYALRHRWL